MKRIRANFVIALTCLMTENIFCSIAADFSDNWFPESLDIISKIISAADKSGNSELQSRIIKYGEHTYAYYLKSINYIGNCKTLGLNCQIRTAPARRICQSVGSVERSRRKR